VAIWAPTYDPEKAAFDASHSWLLGDQRPLARVLGFSAAAILIVAGVALLAHGGWWRPTAVVGLSVSTVLLLVYFNPWCLFILAVNLAMIVGIAWLHWPSRSTVGA
jgi:sulfite exporter TauE/SafE